MGYYSDVVLVLKSNLAEKLRNLCVDPELDEETRAAIHSLLDSADEHYALPSTGTEAWRWKSIKWYGEALDRPLISKVLGNADLEDYRFLCVGEEHGDVEDRGANHEFSAGYYQSAWLEAPASAFNLNKE